MPVSYAGKSGGDLLLDLTTWDGKHHVTQRLRAPRDQSSIQLHPRHITAYAEDGSRSCISPSVKGHSEVAKRFRWSRKESANA